MLISGHCRGLEIPVMSWLWKQWHKNSSGGKAAIWLLQLTAQLPERRHMLKCWAVDVWVLLFFWHLYRMKDKIIFFFFLKAESEFRLHCFHHSLTRWPLTSSGFVVVHENCYRFSPLCKHHISLVSSMTPSPLCVHGLPNWRGFFDRRIIP